MNTKKITSAILAAAICFGSVVTSTASAANSYTTGGSIVSIKDEGKITLGDADISGTIDSADASFVLSDYSIVSTGGVSKLNSAQRKSADVDGNGSVDAIDASHILAYYAYISTGGKLSIVEFMKSQQLPNTGGTTTAPVTTTTTAKTTTKTTTKKPATTTVTAKATTKTTAKPTTKPTTKATTTTKKPTTTTTTTKKATTTTTTTTKAPTTTATTTTEAIRITGIRVTRNEMRVNVGEGDLAAYVSMLPVNAPNMAEKWTSSDESIAKVDNEGWVTGISEGECVITVASVDNPAVFAEIKVTVKDTRSVKTIKLSRAEATIEVGTGALAATVTMLPETAINKNEIWTSSKPEVATVDGEGWVTALKPGNTIITVASEENPAIFSLILVTVVESGTSTNPPVATTTTIPTTTTAPVTTTVTTTAYVPVESIIVQNSEINMTIDSTAKVAVAVLPENATDKTIKWMSSDDSIATVDENGVITAKKEGKCVIMAVSKDNPVATASIIVNADDSKTVTEIRLDKYEMTIPVGGSDIAWVTMLPIDAENKDELWISSDTEIATVDKLGWIYGKSVGECIVTVYSVDNADVKAEIKVTVTDGPVEAPTYTFSQIAPGMSTDKEIAFLTPFPENADGLFIFDYFITNANGQKRLITTPVIESADVDKVITMLTADTNHFTAELYVTNLNTSKRAKIGVYDFVINPRNAITEEEAIEYAFAAVGGLK